MRVPRHLRYLALPALLLALWEMLARGGFMNGQWPHVTDVLAALSGDRTELLFRAWSTTRQVLASCLIGYALALPLGVYLGLGRAVLPGTYALFAAGRTVPVTALLPIFLALFGLEDFFVPIVALPVLLHVTVNTAASIAEASKVRYRLLRSWSVTPRSYWMHVVRFETLEASILTSRVVVPFAFALHIALDYFLSVPEGLGDYLSYKRDRSAWSHVVAGVLVVAFIGVLIAGLTDSIGRRVLKWKRET